MHRLHEFDVVAVSLPEAGPLHNTAFNSHILAMAGATIALEPVSRPQVTWLPEHVQDAFVTFDHEGSLIALKGSLSMRGSVGDLRFKVTDPTRSDRRKATRVNACLPVSLHFTDSDIRSEGLTVDISADGLLIDCDAQTTVDSPLEVTLSLPGTDEPVPAAAVIVRVEAGRVAVQLSSATPEARSRIARFVLERNRARLRLRQQMTDAEDIDF